MTVQELIDKLEKVPDKQMEIRAWHQAEEDAYQVNTVGWDSTGTDAKQFAYIDISDLESDDE